MSIWSDIEDRSCGEKQREEDKNQLRYLSEKYKDFIDIDLSTGEITINLHPVNEVVTSIKKLKRYSLDK
jgi:hypothetical protein